MLVFTYLYCSVCCFNFVMSGVLDVTGVAAVIVSRGDDGRDIDAGGVDPGGDSSTCRLPLLLVDDDVHLLPAKPVPARLC